MASVYNYTFENSGRIGNDRCAISEKDVQNQSFGTYPVQNFFLNNCGFELEDDDIQPGGELLKFQCNDMIVET